MYERELATISSSDLPALAEGEYPIWRVRVNKHTRSWLYDVAAAAHTVTTNVTGNVVTFGAAYELAVKHRLIVARHVPNQEAIALEPPAHFEPQRNDHVIPFPLSPSHISIIRWAQRERLCSPETLFNDGVYLLGALATYAEGTAICIRPDDATEGLHMLPPFNMTMADPP